MVLTATEETLINKVRSLPPTEADKFLHLVNQIVELADGRSIDWSDSWSEEDMRQANAAAMARFEDEEACKR